MPLGTECLDAHACVRRGMRLAEQGGIALPEQHALQRARPHLVERANGQVHPARLHFTRQVRPLHAYRIDAHLRRHLHAHFHQPRHEVDFAHVRHSHPEATVAGGGVEHVLILQGLAKHRQRFADGAGQPLRARGGQHALRGTHEQLVAKGLAQAPQGVADRGLRQIHPPRHGRQIAVFQQMLEQDQQVQVDVAQFGHRAPYYSQNL
ncbi:hypothetical protein G6F57_018216 [Rhizopus arrhizus]|nr:hypothetical protein G6F57_018216 [Rhizopus arrhizus]